LLRSDFWRATGSDLTSLFGRRARKTASATAPSSVAKRRRGRERQFAQLRLESLEARQLLSASPTYVDKNWSFVSDTDLSGSLTVGDIVNDAAAGNVAYGSVAFGTVSSGAHTGSVAGAATIQDAISNTTAGGTVDVGAGTYNESLDINKNVSIFNIGAPGSVNIDAGGAFTGITIENGNSVNISGINLSNFSSTGVHVQQTTLPTSLHISLSNITGGLTGIWVDGGALSLAASTISGAAIFGVQVSGSTGSANILQSEVTGTGTTAAGVIVSAGTATIADSILTASSRGLLVNGSASGVSISGSNLTGNTVHAVENATSQIVDASGNWWGTISETGVKNTTLGLVDFTPYLDSGTDTDGGATGFVGDFSHLHVTALGSQAGSTGRITEAVNDIADGALTGGNRLVEVNAGVYVEDVNVSKAVTLHGAQFGVDARTRSVPASQETIVRPATSNPDPNSPTAEIVMYVAASDVSIDGFTIDGDNPNLTSIVNFGGANIDAAEGIVSYEGVGDITVVNNIVKNTTYTGIDFYNYVNNAATSDNLIQHNLIENLGDNQGYGYGIGVLVYNNFYADVTENKMTGVRIGVQTGNFNLANPGPAAHISNNEIAARRLGIFHNLQYQSASPWTIANNSITAINDLSLTHWDGIFIGSLQGSADVIVQNNTIDGSGTTLLASGYNVWNTPTTGSVTISGGSVTGVDYGVFVNNFEGYASNADDTHATVSGVDITARQYGVYVKDSPSNTNGATVSAVVTGDTDITTGGSGTGIFVSGSDASATISGNDASIHGNVIGVDVNAGSATIDNNHIYENGTGIRFTNGGSSTSVSGNNFDGGANLDNGTDVRLDSGAGTVTFGNGNAFAGDTYYIDNQSSQNIHLESTTGTTYESYNPATLADDFRIEDHMFHKVDNLASGLITWVLNNVYVTTPGIGSTDSSVQRGVSAAPGGYTVNLEDGTYVEQVEVDHSVTLLGQSQAGAIIQSPALLPVSFTTSATHHPVVYIHGTTASVANLTVDGNGQGGGANNRIDGIAYRNAGGTVNQVTIEHVRQTPLNGVQEGVGIYAFNDDSVTRVLNITDNTIFDYQKNAMAISGNDLTANISGNTVTGAGDTALIAQNGIQVGFGTVGHISNNIISGHEYSGPGGGSDPLNDVQSVGILLFDAGDGTTVSGNTVDGNDIGIYSLGGTISVTGNHLGTISANRYEGIFVDQSSSTVSGNDIAGGSIGIAVVAFSGNTGNSSAAITSNTVTGTGKAIYVHDDDPTHTADALAMIQGNSLAGSGAGANGVGIYVDGGAIVDAGSTAGDGDPTGLGPSNGGNILTGYTGASGHYAIQDENLQANSDPNVLAKFNDFGPYVDISVIENYVLDDSDAPVNTRTQVIFTGALNQQPAPNVVFVDDNWAGSIPGSDTDGPGGGSLGNGTAFGVDEFATIQDAVNAVASGGTVYVYNGSYVENVSIPKSLTISGESQAGVVVHSASTTDPTGGGSLGSPVILIGADNVTIQKLTVDGDNPNHVSGVVVGGADIDATTGIITDWNEPVTYTGMTVKNVTVQNVFERGIEFANGNDNGTGTFDIENDTVTNVQGDSANSIAIFNYGGSGVIAVNQISFTPDAIATNHSYGTNIHDNVITHSGTGIHSDNNGDGVGALADSIHDNHISLGSGTGSSGIFVFVPYVNVSVSNNTISDVDTGLAAYGGQGGTASFSGNIVSVNDGGTGALITRDTLGFGLMPVSASLTNNQFSGGDVGIELLSLTISPTISGNTIDGADIGVYAFDNAAPITITGGTIENAHDNFDAGNGVLLINKNLISNAYAANNESVTLDGVSLVNNDTAIQVVDYAAIVDHVSAGTLTIGLTNGTSISGTAGQEGLLLDGPGVSVIGNSINDTSFTFAGNPYAYIQLMDGALGGVNPTTLDATGATFDGFQAGSQPVNAGTLPTFYHIEDYVGDYLDTPSVGYVKLKNGYEFVAHTSEDATADAIQRGVNVAQSGDIVEVQAGTYTGNIVINQSVSLRGAQYGVDGRTRSVPQETVITAAASSDALIDVNASNVTVDGFTIDGANLATRDIRFNEVDNGVVQNNIITGAVRGVQSNGDLSFGNTGGLVTQNLIHDLTADPNDSYGVLAFDASYVSVTNNVMTGLDVGMFEQYYYEPNGLGNANNVISGNVVTANVLGYGTNERASQAATTALSNNIFHIGAGGVGIQLYNIYKTNGITLTNNTIDGSADIGVYAFISGGSASITGGSITSTAGSIGVQLTNYLADFTYAATGDGAVSISGASIGGFATGVAVQDDPLGAFAVSAEISGDTNITGAVTGILVSGADASANIHDNDNSIHGNTIGIDVNGGSATITNNHIYNNGTGIRFTSSGSGSVSGNNFDGGADPDNTTDVRLDSDAGTVSFGNGNAFAGDTYYIDNQSSQNIHLESTTGTTYEAFSPATLADDFRIEDHMHHKVDTDTTLATTGLITWVANNVYVTTPGIGSTDSSIQRGVDATPASGYTVNVEHGTYTENVTVNHDVTIDGEGNGPTPTVTLQSNVGGSNLINVTSTTATDNVTIKDIAFQGVGPATADIGVNVPASANFNTLTVDRSTFTGLHFNGIQVLGNASTGISARDVVISNSTFTNNGYDNGGAGDIDLFVYNGDASLSNLTLSNNGALHSRFGIQFRGKGNDANLGTDFLPMGTVSLSNIDVSGSYKTTFITFQRYTTANTLSFNNVALGGTTSAITGTFGALMRFDAVGGGTVATPATVNLGNTHFRGESPTSNIKTDIEFAPDNNYAFLVADAKNTIWDVGTPNVAASALTVAQAYDVEDRINHYTDDLSLVSSSYKGWAEIQNGQAFVTPDSILGGSIQHAVDVVDTGGTVHIKAGSYTGSVDTDTKNVTLAFGASPAQVTITGNLTLHSGDTVKIDDINGTNASSDYDNVIVTGTATLGNATLNVSSPTYTPADGDTLTIVNAATLVGTFGNYAEGAVVTGGFRIHYDTVNGDVKLIENSHPVANAGGPYSTSEGSGVTLNGSGSFDPDAPVDTITDYTWTVNGHTLAQHTAMVTLTWADLQALGITDGPNDYNVSLVVTDNLGATDSDSTNLHLNDTAPTIALTGANDTNEGATYTLTLGAITDPGQDTVSDYYIHWGDGNTDHYTAAQIATLLNQVTHTYADDDPSGTPSDPYTITVDLADEDGTHLAAGTKGITVHNVAPTLTGTTGSTINENGSATVTTTISDPGTQDVFSVQVNWQDGSPADTVPGLGLSNSSGSVGSTSYTWVAATRSLTLHHTYLDDGVSPGNNTASDNYSVALNVTDDDTGTSGPYNATVTVNNVAPVLSNVTLTPSINEGDSVTLSGDWTDPGTLDTFTLTVNWGEGTPQVYNFGAGAHHFSVTHTYLDDNPTNTSSDVYTVNLTLADDDTGSDSTSKQTTVNNVPPVLDTLSIGTPVNVGVNTDLTGTYHDVGTQDTHQLMIDWDGDNNYDQTVNVSGGNFDVTHSYAASGVYTVHVKLVDDDTGFATGTTSVTVHNPNALEVTNFVNNNSGFDVTFNKPINLADINLYDGQDAAADTPDAVVIRNGDTAHPIQGSLVWNAATNTMSFVQTGGVLADGTYQVTLVSSFTAFHDASGKLDGDGDQIDTEVPDDYMTSFVIGPTAPGTRVVSIKDFARGPGQTVNDTPESPNGLAVSVNNTTNMVSINFELDYDPNLLQVFGAQLASDPVSKGWNLTFNNAGPGQAFVSAFGVTPLSGAAEPVILLNALVPNAAPYEAAEVLKITNLLVGGNSGILPSKADYAVHKNVYLGDADGDGTYTGFDAALISRVVAHLDTGFDANDWTDPVIVANVTRTGSLNSLDASYVAQKAVHLPRPEIPNLPGLSLTYAAGGIDPELSIPANVPAQSGDGFIVPVNITSAGENVYSATFHVTYDPTKVQFVSAATGNFSSGWQVVSNDDGAGTVYVTVYTPGVPNNATSGTIANLHFDTLPGLSYGDTTSLGVGSESATEGGLTWTHSPSDNGSATFLVHGDWNLDGSLTAADVPAMMQALANLASYQSSHSLSNAQLLFIGDNDHDGQITNGDVQGEIHLLITAPPGPAPAEAVVTNGQSAAGGEQVADATSSALPVVPLVDAGAAAPIVLNPANIVAGNDCIVTAPSTLIESTNVAPNRLFVANASPVSAPVNSDPVESNFGPATSAPLASVAVSDASGPGVSSQLALGLYTPQAEAASVSAGQAASQPESVPTVSLDDYYASLASELPVDNHGAAIGSSDSHESATDDCFANLELAEV
jgi:hypothetical protein